MSPTLEATMAFDLTNAPYFSSSEHCNPFAGGALNRHLSRLDLRSSTLLMRGARSDACSHCGQVLWKYEHAWWPWSGVPVV